ncbi:Biotin-protein ligase [Desulfovibrio sp. X2]|uniref:BPL-N domain-containing protein n=1 Tax=Desulfovibrio sp. X2 TaxID=941449 RepID=UPI000358885E|nr:BPL-N domain-containing protein [Desulfovibrio sp. X2]EPR43939.1 Biotin-protein ligase [Desulfovibrio sp. X2]
MAEIMVLWDDAHLWGLLVQRALAGWGLAPRLVTAAEVAGGVLSRDRAKLLVVPGGNARAKARALGREGRAAVRAFVERGGGYLGFCGGAGLGLTSDGEATLGLCPWRRKPFTDRMQHLVSGFMRVLPGDPDPFIPAAGQGAEQGRDVSAEPEFPVWWPGRFAAEDCEGVTVLARYGGPGSELWVADLRLDSLPVSVFDDWEAEYGFSLWPSFMQGQPCLVRGTAGQGSYVLSYAHLETPDASAANAWLAHILGRFLGRGLGVGRVPAWRPQDGAAAWDDPLLARAARVLEELVALGREHFLLFDRASWLVGWRRGLPGLQLNALRTLILTCRGREPDDAARAFWTQAAPAFTRDLDLYQRAVTGFLLAERLDMTLSHSPGAPAVTGLKERRESLFGPPQTGGGLHAQLQAPLEELARLLLTA